jgi:hypothetical protein
MAGNHARDPLSFWIKPVRVVVVLLVLFAAAFLLTTQPIRTRYPSSNQKVSAGKLRGHVEMLSVQFAPRNYKRIWNLNKCADYILAQFRESGAKVSEQSFEVDGKIYRNVIASFGAQTESRIVVGAHYDSCQDTPGADDNASGVAGLIELAHLLGRTELKQHVQLVAYTLEEPPYFRTGNMGSARHAYSLRRHDEKVEIMISLEMIGYFSDKKGSQLYPSPLLKMFYPDTGNYIAIIGSYSDRKFVRRIKAYMRGASDLPVYSMCAFKSFPGLDYSDHLNYWNHGYKAVMVTDTAFMRNLNYHGPSDTFERLDYERMSDVVIGVYEAVVRLANNGD